MELDPDYQPEWPLRQGDLIGFHQWETRHPTDRFGIIITADCDLAQVARRTKTVYLPVVTLKDFVEHIWCPQELSKKFVRQIKVFADMINAQRKRLDPTCHILSNQQTEEWLVKGGAESIADTVAADDSGQHHKLVECAKIAVALRNMVNGVSETSALATAIEAELMTTTKNRADCRASLLKRAQDSVSEPVRDRQERRQRYISKNDRPRYLMNLPAEADRETVLDIYDLFREQLRSAGLISIDQLVADFIGYLDSFRWDTLRRAEGYDAVFVDEFHLFNAHERAVFVSLMKADTFDARVRCGVPV